MIRTLYALALAAALVLPAGCVSEAKRQSAADAVAGAHAVKARAHQTGDAVLPVIADGIEDHARAAVGDAELPEPRTSPTAILDDAPAYREQAAKDREASSRGWVWWALGGLATALAALKALPGTAGWVAGAAHRLLENRIDRRAREREEQLATGMRDLIREVERAPKELSQPVKDFVAKKLPELAPVIRAIRDREG